MLRRGGSAATDSDMDAEVDLTAGEPGAYAVYQAQHIAGKSCSSRANLVLIAC